MLEIVMLVISYIYGSIPFALVIGKLFYKTDVRQHGSGNLGGTNTGRVLGKKAGFFCIVLDASKALVVVLIARYLCDVTSIYEDIPYLCALACVFGHCFPIFANFRGGKAVSTAIGYFLAVHPIAALLPIIIFLIVLKLSKYVSLSSMLGAISVVFLLPFLNMSLVANLATICIILLLVYRHKDNIKRIRNGTENKINWM